MITAENYKMLIGISFQNEENYILKNYIFNASLNFIVAKGEFLSIT